MITATATTTTTTTTIIIIIIITIITDKYPMYRLPPRGPGVGGGRPQEGALQKILD